MHVFLLNYEFKVALFIVHRKKNLVRNNRKIVFERIFLAMLIWNIGMK